MITEDSFAHEVIRAMGLAKIPSHFVHAFKQTGRILTQQACENLTNEELAEWNDAIKDGRARHGSNPCECEINQEAFE